MFKGIPSLQVINVCSVGKYSVGVAKVIKVFRFWHRN